MSVQVKKFYRGIPSAGGYSTAYSTVSGVKAVLTYVRITNTTSSDAVLNLYVGTAPAPNQYNAILESATIKANDVLVLELKEVLDAGESIFAYQLTANALHLSLSGVEVS